MRLRLAAAETIGPQDLQYAPCRMSARCNAAPACRRSSWRGTSSLAWKGLKASCCLYPGLRPALNGKLQGSSGMASGTYSSWHALHHLLHALLWLCSAVSSVSPTAPFPPPQRQTGHRCPTWFAPQLQTWAWRWLHVVKQLACCRPRQLPAAVMVISHLRSLPPSAVALLRLCCLQLPGANCV